MTPILCDISNKQILPISSKKTVEEQLESYVIPWNLIQSQIMRKLDNGETLSKREHIRVTNIIIRESNTEYRVFDYSGILPISRIFDYSY
jgi:hypothetical protein